MHIEWNLVVAIAMPIVTLFLGVWVNSFFQSKPKLLSHHGFISSHRLSNDSPGNAPTVVNTHSVVVRNLGRKSAHNVRVGHRFLPDFDVYPDIEYTVKELPGGGKELVFPTLVPKKEVTINYLYFPPTTWDQINTHLESDEGPAKVVNVLLQPEPPKLLVRTLQFLVIVGLVSIIYVAYELIVMALG